MAQHKEGGRGREREGEEEEERRKRRGGRGTLNLKKTVWPMLTVNNIV